LINKYGYERPKFEDRDILERIIFPHILSYYAPQTVLDIGREGYTQFYNRFFRHSELWTLDYDPENEEFGANNHITDDVANLRKYFDENYLDLIIMNGVFGWGVNKEEHVQDTFNAFYEVLKPGGILILGWNDDVVPLKKIEGLNKLKPLTLKPFDDNQTKCINGTHFYNFYIKK
jgi:SAM-dependent methyltransferase